MLSSWGLRSRLALLTGLALLPVFGLFAWIAAGNQEDAVQLAQSRLQSDALLLAASQQPLVDAAKQLLGDMAAAPTVRDGPSALCGDYLSKLQALQPAYAELGVAAPGGTLLCHSQSAQVGKPAADLAVLQSAVDQKQFVAGNYVTGSSTGRSGLTFALPVYGAEGLLRSVVFAAVDVHAFGAGAAMVPFGAEVHAVLTDRKGTILAAHPRDAARVGSQQSSPAVRAFLAAPDMRTGRARDTEGLEHLYAFSTVPGAAGNALFAAVSTPSAAITAKSRQTLLAELAILLAMAVFGMACAWWVGKRLVVRPAEAILREANELAVGNLAARVEVGPAYQGELGHLARTFNRMAESLELRRSELDNALARIGKEHRLLDLIINSMSEGVIAVDLEGRFLLFNAAARSIFVGMDVETPLSEWRRRHELLTPDGRTVYADEDRPLTRALRGESADSFDVLLRMPGAGDRVLRMNLRSLRDERHALLGGLIVFTDITAQKQGEEFARAQEQVLELIASGLPLARSLEAIVGLIEGRAPGCMCSVLLCHEGLLRHGAAPSLPHGYNREIDGLAIAEGVGACGTAAFLRRPVVVEDVASNPLMHNYRDLLLGFGLRSCWSTPVLSASGQVLATFAIYHATPHRPEAEEVALADTAVRLARIAIERLQAEEALLGSEARFRELADNIHDVFYNRDIISGRMLYISPAYETVWQRSRESLYADSASYLLAIHPDDRGRVETAKRQYAGGVTSDLEYRVVRPNGEVRWVRDYAYPIVNAAGTVERVVGTARDITDRKLADLELARTTRALKMLSLCNEALTRINDEQELLLQVCRLAVEVGGYRMAWVGYAQDDGARSILPMAHAGHEDGYLSSIQLSWDAGGATGRGPAGQTLRSGEVRISEDIVRGDNQFCWSEEAAQHGFRSAVFLPLRDSRRTFGLLCMYSATVEKPTGEEIRLLQELADNLAFGIGSVRLRLEREQAQQEVLRLNIELEERVRQRTAQLQAANRELESFSYSVSHDLRTPLSAIDGFSGLLDKDIGGGGMSSERGKHYLQRIRAGVAQMGELIDALLSLARVTKTSLRWERVDLSAMAAQVLAGHREREPGRDAVLQIQPGLAADGDPRLLQQLLENLLGNAWKFSARQPQTRIAFTSAPGPGGETVYTVRDHGAGFDMTYSAKLFGAFQRLHTVTEFEGTGIGLATVHRIVMRHGGRVWAESAPGEGARFYFTLGRQPVDE